METTKKSVLDDDKIGSLLFKLSLPSLFGMLVTTLYNVIDTIFVGHLVGSNGIAGLSIVFPIQMLSLGLGQMMGMGGASSISRLIGSGNIPKAQQILGNALTGAAILSIVMAIAGLTNPDFWLLQFGASEATLPYARDYLTIILIGIFFQTAAVSLGSMISAEGNARRTMVGMIIGAVVNIILAAIFMIPLGMGVKGSALATIIAQFISFSFLLHYYYSGKSYIKLHLSNLIPKLNIMKSILAIGFSSFARTLGGSLSAIVVNKLLLTYGGDLALSSFGVLNRIMMLVMMPGIVIGQGLQPILGFNYGAKRFDRGLRAIKIAMISATICSVSVFLIIYFSPEVFIRVFTNEENLIALGSHAAKFVFLAVWLLGYMFITSLVFQALGKATQAFITSLSRPVIFLIPILFITPQFWQLDGVWMAFPISDICTLILTSALLVPQLRNLQKLSK